MPGLNTAAIVAMFVAFIGLVIIFIGGGVVMGSRKARIKDNGTVGGNIGIGILIMAFGGIMLAGMAVIYTFQDAINSVLSLRK